tara:strand:- start:1454 stop:1669 length:216 start_codon:yes stop_codon:yes gene_type:complete
LITLIIGIFLVAVGIGRRDHALDSAEKSIVELRNITSDLVKTQLDNMGNNKVLTQRIDDLQRRVAILEAND